MTQISPDVLDALERKYLGLACQEIEAKKRAGQEITPEWLDALERKYMAMAFDCAVEELGQVKHRLETDEAYAAFIIDRAEQKTCPFCPIMLPGSPDMWNPVGDGDFFGASATIGDIPSCGDCAQAAECGGTEDALLAELATIRAQVAHK